MRFYVSMSPAQEWRGLSVDFLMKLQLPTPLLSHHLAFSFPHRRLFTIYKYTRKGIIMV